MKIYRFYTHEKFQELFANMFTFQLILHNPKYIRVIQVFKRGSGTRESDLKEENKQLKCIFQRFLSRIWMQIEPFCVHK